MNDAAYQWLAERAAKSGTLACGLRGPDGNFTSHSADQGFQAGAIESILNQFGNLSAAVFTETPAPQWSTWTYEHGSIRFVERPDGWRLALVVRPNSEAVPTLDSLSQEFLTLPLEQQAD